MVASPTNFIVGGPQSGFLLNHAYELAVFRTFLFELDVAVCLREQGVIATDTDVYASMKTRATLADNDVSGYDFLATENLDAKTFGLGIAAVLATTACFFVCHCGVP